MASYSLMSSSVATLGPTVACLGDPLPAKLGGTCQRNCDVYSQLRTRSSKVLNSGPWFALNEEYYTRGRNWRWGEASLRLFPASW